MPSAKPSAFAGGGLLRGEDGTIVGLTFTDVFPGGEGSKTKKPGKARDDFASLYARVYIQVDGADKPTDRTLFVGNAKDYTFEGATITGEKPLGKGAGWYIFLQSLVDAGFDEANFPDDPLTADYTSIIGARCRFNWQKNEKATKKYGQTVSKKDPSKKYDREDLIVESYYGQVEVKPAKGTTPAKAAAPSTTKAAKPAKKAAEPEAADVESLAKKTILDAVAAAKDGKLTKSKLSVKILTLLANVDADVRGDVREWAYSDENLAKVDGVVYDAASQTLSLDND